MGKAAHGEGHAWEFRVPKRQSAELQTHVQIIRRDTPHTDEINRKDNTKSQHAPLMRYQEAPRGIQGTVYHTLSRTEILFFFAFITHLVVRQQLDHTFSREMRAQSHIKSRVNYYQEIQNSKTKIQICTIEKKNSSTN